MENKKKALELAQGFLTLSTFQELTRNESEDVKLELLSVIKMLTLKLKSELYSIEDDF